MGWEGPRAREDPKVLSGLYAAARSGLGLARLGASESLRDTNHRHDGLVSKQHQFGDRVHAGQLERHIEDIFAERHSIVFAHTQLVGNLEHIVAVLVGSQRVASVAEHERPDGADDTLRL